MSDHDSDNLNFITDGTLDRILNDADDRDIERLHECFNRKLKRIHNDCETMQDCCRKLKAAGEDVTEELNDAEVTISALLLVVRILQREQRSE